MDSSDITVWSQLAGLASSLGNLLLARTALEQALVCHSNHWPAIEALCTVLFALQDYSGNVCPSGWNESQRICNAKT